MAGHRITHCAFCGVALSQPPPVQCGSCGGEHYRNAVPCAGAVIVRDAAVLLMRRAGPPYAGGWDLPGGFCEESEHPELTVVREVREEVGLEVVVASLLGIWLDLYEDGTEPPRTTMNVIYLARPKGHDAAEVASEEAEAVGWFGFDALPAEIAFPRSTGPAITAARSMLDGPA